VFFQIRGDSGRARGVCACACVCVCEGDTGRCGWRLGRYCCEEDFAAVCTQRVRDFCLVCSLHDTDSRFMAESLHGAARVDFS